MRISDWSSDVCSSDLKYDKASGKRVAGWEGDPKLFPHLNSCAVVKAELVCAASNYPKVPMASRVEIFDAKTIRHIRTGSRGRMVGSLPELDWQVGRRWAVLAHNEEHGGRRGGAPRVTRLVREDSTRDGR